MMTASEFDAACRGKSPAFASALLGAEISQSRWVAAFDRYARTRRRSDFAKAKAASLARDSALRILAEAA
jgi:hypothetical protein